MLLSSPSANIITDIYRIDITNNRQFLSNSESRFNFSWLTPEAQFLTVQGDRCQRKRGANVPWCVCCHLETKSVNNTWHFQLFKNVKKNYRKYTNPQPFVSSILLCSPSVAWDALGMGRGLPFVQGFSSQSFAIPSRMYSCVVPHSTFLLLFTCEMMVLLS